jgi:hypothetical protein
MSEDVTDMVQRWHNDGDDDAHAIYNVGESIAEETVLRYNLEPTQEQQKRLEFILHEIIEESVDWDKIAADDENAREWEEAKQSALYK